MVSSNRNRTGDVKNEDLCQKIPKFKYPFKVQEQMTENTLLCYKSLVVNLESDAVQYVQLILA